MYIPDSTGKQIEKLLVLFGPLLSNYEALVKHLNLIPCIDLSEAKEISTQLKDSWKDVQLGLYEPDRPGGEE